MVSGTRELGRIVQRNMWVLQVCRRIFCAHTRDGEGEGTDANRIAVDCKRVNVAGGQSCVLKSNG